MSSIAGIPICYLCKRPYSRLGMHLKTYHRLNTANDNYQCLMALSTYPDLDNFSPER